MTEQTAIQERKETGLLAMLNDERVMTRFQQAAGEQAGSVIVNIINAANSNPEIYKCEPASVVTAALTAAAMNISLSPALGEGAILPFKKSRKVGNEWQETYHASLVVMKRGIKKMAMNTNKYRILNVFRVYAGQSIEEDQMTGKKTIVGQRTSGEVIGYGGFLQLFNGFEAVTYWPIEKLIAHGQKYSPTYNKRDGKFNDKSKWITDPEVMYEKTVMKDLILNHGIISERDRALLEKAEEGISDDAEIVTNLEDMTEEGEKQEVIQHPNQPVQQSFERNMADLYGEE